MILLVITITRKDHTPLIRKSHYVSLKSAKGSVKAPVFFSPRLDWCRAEIRDQDGTLLAFGHYGPQDVRRTLKRLGPTWKWQWTTLQGPDWDIL